MNELLQEMIAAEGPIDTVWNMFIFAHISLVGGLYALDRRLSRAEKMAILFVYGIFAYINWASLIFSYGLYNSIIADIKAMPLASVGGFHAVRNFLEDSDFRSRGSMTTVVHAIAAALVFFFIVLEDRISFGRRPRKVELTKDSHEGARA